MSASPETHAAIAAEPPAAHLSARHYAIVWAVLVLLTGLTVGVSFLDMKKFVVLTAVTIATTKAALVLLYFMHVRYESRTIKYFVVVALGALAIFFALMFSDIVYRYG
jgi:cytochrome c oxidase subunit 4